MTWQQNSDPKFLCVIFSFRMNFLSILWFVKFLPLKHKIHLNFVSLLKYLLKSPFRVYMGNLRTILNSIRTNVHQFHYQNTYIIIFGSCLLRIEHRIAILARLERIWPQLVRFICLEIYEWIIFLPNYSHTISRGFLLRRLWIVNFYFNVCQIISLMKI